LTELRECLDLASEKQNPKTEVTVQNIVDPTPLMFNQHE